MTERLYYHDSFLREFDAQVLSCEPAGERWQVILDRTALYPTSGGQPFDTGTLGDASVLEVIDRESDDTVLHITDRALPPAQFTDASIGSAASTTFSSTPASICFPRRLSTCSPCRPFRFTWAATFRRSISPRRPSLATLGSRRAARE